MIINEEDYVQHAEYDPAKAREYYLRTRELKGRRPGDVRTPTGRTAARSAPAPLRFHKAIPKGKPSAKPKDVKSVTAIRVAALKIRLKKLKTLLAALTKDAKARSGIDPETKDDTKGADKAGTEKSKPKTAAQKAKDAEAAKERYDESREKELAKQIADVEAKIAKARADLTDSLGRAKAKMLSPTAKK